jgi:hypothetical protein
MSGVESNSTCHSLRLLFLPTSAAKTCQVLKPTVPAALSGSVLPTSAAAKTCRVLKPTVSVALSGYSFCQHQQQLKHVRCWNQQYLPLSPAPFCQHQQQLKHLEVLNPTIPATLSGYYFCQHQQLKHVRCWITIRLLHVPNIQFILIFFESAHAYSLIKSMLSSWTQLTSIVLSSSHHAYVIAITSNHNVKLTVLGLWRLRPWTLCLDTSSTLNFASKDRQPCLWISDLEPMDQMTKEFLCALAYCPIGGHNFLPSAESTFWNQSLHSAVLRRISCTLRMFLFIFT